MRTRDMDKLDRKLAKLLGWKITFDNRWWCSGEERLCRVHKWIPSRDIAQALDAVRQAGLIVGRIMESYSHGWCVTLIGDRRFYHNGPAVDSLALAVTLALIAALEARP